MTCRGDDHCCWLYSRPCRFLAERPDAARRWVCTLREQLGSWDRVHTDRRYLTQVQPVLDTFGVESCGTWEPPAGQCCNREDDGG